MTNAQLYKVLKTHKYIIVHNWIGVPCGINCKAALHLSLQKTPDINMRKASHIASYRPCSLQEYISTKIGFL
jgi:hypothetical protein